MTALVVSIWIWVLVAFFATDDYCRKHEKRALRFLIVVGTVLTAVGLWRFEAGDLSELTLRDWRLFGFYVIYLVYLRSKGNLFKKQSEVQGRNVSPFELQLEAIPDKSLVRRFRTVRAIMWGYIALCLIPFLWRLGEVLL